MKRIIIAALSIAAMFSCTKEEGISATPSSDVEVTFANAQIATRTSGNSWEEQDQVGIFMYETGKTDNTYSLVRENILYTSDKSGKFTVGTGIAPIYYPQEDKVDLYAYYPHDATLTTGWVTTIDIAGQNLADGSFDQGAVDFMTAKIEETDKSSDGESFEFDHRLSMLTFIITPKASISSLEGVKITLNNINTEASFSVLTGDIDTSAGDTTGSITLNGVASETDALGNVTEVTATAIVIPELLSSGAEIKFTFSDFEHTAMFPVSPTFEVGKNHTYNISVGYEVPSFGNSTIKDWGVQDEENLYSEPTSAN